MNDQGCLITTNFSDRLEDSFGKLVIAPTPQAQAMWELWRKNPDMFTLAPGYLVEKNKKGEIVSKELVELSLIPKVMEKK